MGGDRQEGGTSGGVRPHVLVGGDHQEGGTSGGVRPHVLGEGDRQEGGTSGIQSLVLGADHQEGGTTSNHVWMSELDNELFMESREKVRQSRSEKREERVKRCQPESSVVSEDAGGQVCQHELDISAKEMQDLQAADLSLRGVLKVAEIQSSRFGRAFFLKAGLLYRRWVPSGRDGDEMSVGQLVLP